MIAVYKYVVYSKNMVFLKYILFDHRNDYCIQMILSGKTEELPVLKSFQAIINLVFEVQNTIESPLRTLYFTPNFTDVLLQ